MMFGKSKQSYAHSTDSELQLQYLRSEKDVWVLTQKGHITEWLIML